ncbi:MAG: UDP-glucose/GDP-mannose dehydrogenase family protein [Candidatus Gracilibacteria bacterium]|nr:UDP-glucose/GDP-mannose dehydrogenase family protein [Candidatus Peregrinibacteria bacterium]
MNVAVFGCGYVGLTCAVGLAELGHTVVGVDIDEKKLALLKEGKSPLFEEGLEATMQRQMTAGQLTFTHDGESAIQKSDVVMCAVSLPGERTDFGAVMQVAQLFARLADGKKLFVNKSTVPVGSAEKIGEIIAPSQIVANPEFLQEGTALRNFLHPERVVVGLNDDDENVKEKMKELYCYDEEIPFVFTSLRNAELIKYASNVFLATKISFANELANLCEATGGDVQEVVRGMGFDSRIGSDFLQAGIGFGGSCLPKSVQTLLDNGKDLDCDLPLFEAVKQVNESRVDTLFSRLEQTLGSLQDKKIAVWGATFKPNTNDIREAPSLKVLQKLIDARAQICVFDPVASLDGLDVATADDLYAGLQDAEALLILTEWDVFKNPDFVKMKSLMNQPLVVDGRNIFDPAVMKDQGFQYVSVGRA